MFRKREWFLVTVSFAILSNELALMECLSIDGIREKYYDIEMNLQKYNNTDSSKKLLILIESHKNFVNFVMPQNQSWNGNQYKIVESIQSNNWENLTEIFYKTDQFYEEFKKQIEFEQSLILFADAILNSYESTIFKNINYLLIKRESFYYQISLLWSSLFQDNQQSAQQFLYDFYQDISLLELKIYILNRFSAIIKSLEAPSYESNALIERCSDYKVYSMKTWKSIQHLLHISDRSIWRSDPDRHMKSKTYDEVTRLLQGYVINEIDMNYDRRCDWGCPFYQRAKQENCYKPQECGMQMQCNGQLYDCTTINNTFSIHSAELNDTRRYEALEIIKKNNINDNRNYQFSAFRNLLFQCNYCLCLCDEQSGLSDRYFNLREKLSDIQNNKVVTGVRFRKRNRIFHLELQEGILRPKGEIDVATLMWVPSDDYRIRDFNVTNKRDYFTLSYAERTIGLDDVTANDSSQVVTGVRFSYDYGYLSLHVHFTEFNFETGKLNLDASKSFWKANAQASRSEVLILNSDIPTRVDVKSTPIANDKQRLIKFGNTDIGKDAAQTTVPFIDIQDVVAKKPLPLSGLGIYFKGKPLHSGYIAPKIILNDLTHKICT